MIEHLLLYSDLDKKIEYYGYHPSIFEGCYHRNDMETIEVYNLLKEEKEIPAELEFKFLLKAEWNIPVIKLFCEVNYCKSLDELPDGIKVVAEAEDFYYYIRTHLLRRCVLLTHKDNPKTIVELFQYAMFQWGIDLDEDFTVIEKEKFEGILAKSIQLKGFIRTDDIRRWIEEAC